MNEFLIDDWQLVLKKSLSVLMAALSVLLGLMESNSQEVLELFSLLKPYIQEGMFGHGSTLFAALAILGRIKRQPSMHTKELQ